MQKLTKKDNLNKVVRVLPDQSMDYMIRMSSGIAGKLLGTISFEKMSNMAKVWDADMIADGMNFLVDMSNKQKVFYSFWAESELKSDKEKRKTGLAAFLQSHESKFVVVCAGGGYGSVATMQEAFPVAKALYEKGYHVFVLQYRCGKAAKAPNPLEDLANAIQFILVHEQEFKIDISDYAIVGFSAGGHLVAEFGTENLGYKHYSLPKPGILILGYPVITMLKYTHLGSRDNFLGKEDREDAEVQERFSVECHISKDYPKTYVWQCDHDNTVPIKNTELLVEAFEKNCVPYRYETFHSDAHGWGLGNHTKAEGWLNRAVDYWRNEA